MPLALAEPGSLADRSANRARAGGLDQLQRPMMGYASLAHRESVSLVGADVRTTEGSRGQRRFMAGKSLPSAGRRSAQTGPRRGDKARYGGLFRVRRREPPARAVSVGQSRLHSARLCPRIRGTALAGERFAAFDREEVTRRLVRSGSRHPLRTWLPQLAVAWGCASWPTFGRPATHQVLIGGRGIRTADALSAAR